MGGEDDPMHPSRAQADIAAALPPYLVEFERFPNCGHGVIPDGPDRAMAVIRDSSSADRQISVGVTRDSLRRHFCSWHETDQPGRSDDVR